MSSLIQVAFFIDEMFWKGTRPRILFCERVFKSVDWTPDYLYHKKNSVCQMLLPLENLPSGACPPVTEGKSFPRLVSSFSEN